jgi:hypothetical protein
MLLISIDPERDTVANLSALGTSRKLDKARWTLARTGAASVRKIAAVLGIQYRKLPRRELQPLEHRDVADAGRRNRRADLRAAQSGPGIAGGPGEAHSAGFEEGSRCSVICSNGAP